ncbi:MAG: hypothetical protein UU66_C0017G0009, partial [Parcubacteria group bacterium GW2011_GWB1_41_5]
MIKLIINNFNTGMKKVMKFGG